MRKIVLIIIALLSFNAVKAQELLHLYQGGHVVFEKAISDIDSIYFQNSSSVFSYGNDFRTFATASIDSVTFSSDTLAASTDIYITYNGNSVTVINPLASAGVNITTSGANVTVVSTAGIQDVVYHLSGSTTDGSLYITPDKRFTLSLEGVTITNSAGPAIDVLIDKAVNVVLANGSQNYLNDGTGNAKKAALQSKSQLIFNGGGTLTVSGAVRNGIHSDDFVKINSGNIVVTSAVADGIHCDWFIMNGGMVDVTSGDDGIDGDEGFIEINGGEIVIHSTAVSARAMKCDSTITVNNGSITIYNSGNQSKGMKSGLGTTINGGTIHITSSGTTVLESTTAGNDPSYCSAIVSDAFVTINGGDITLTLPTSNGGGRGISSEGPVTIAGGTVNITTAGAGAAYTVSGSTKDSYSCCCIKSDLSIILTGGHITCTSTGNGGKGINSKGTITIGETGATDSLLTLNVTTSGARITVSSGGGWPGPGGSSGDYCNPKGIKAAGALTVNSGIITVNCTQNTEGGECLESKTILTINGGQLTLVSNYDDAMNASSRLNINGGTIYAASSNNDAIDCNGSMYISGGFTIASSIKSPEEAFDCDNNTFSITGGTIVGTGVSGNMFSNPTASACTQHSLKYTGSSNKNIQIVRNSDNTVILTFHIPTMSGGGGWPGGSSSSNAVLLFSSPELTQGSYTLKYNGTISGGSDFHNYYTGATYSGGSTKTFTVGSTFSITTVQ
ncbi:MAG: carbohydrate-binding domain-containing protein [Bacteroidales bacterium]|nr:carbohydrate-binding domain-containing protein [Bacteroidales bacterium]